MRETANVINKISPEHLEICTKKPESYLKLINNAGSISFQDLFLHNQRLLVYRQSVIKISKSGIERLGIGYK